MSNSYSDSEKLRIQELLTELQESRADQRHNDTVIIQTISATATILGIVSGISHITTGNGAEVQRILFNPAHVASAQGIKKIVYSLFSYLTPARIFFVISCLAFCTAFSFITTRGIRGALQYYYIQNLEDRLHTLINNQRDDVDRDFLIHYDDYIAPITTLNTEHVSSSYTAWHYISLLLVAICAVGCSLTFVLLQYLSIQDLLWADTFFLFITFSIMVVALLMFVRTANNAKQIAQFAMDTAHVNLRVRLDKEKERKKYERAPVFRHYLKYFLFPRAKEWYKAGITAAGYIYTCVVFHQKASLLEIIVLLISFEFLLYGARYQINDIRGFKEDKETNTIRLFVPDEKYPQKTIQNSWSIAKLKVFTAILLTLIFLWDKRKAVFLCSFFLLLSIIIYEYSKWRRGRAPCGRHSSDYFVYFSVGSGYPLRFFTGALVAQPVFCLDQYAIHFWISLCSLFFLGIFASLLSWAQTISHIIKDDTGSTSIVFNYKRHYARLYDYLTDRNVSDRVPLLRNGRKTKNELICLWNVCYCLSTCFCLLAARLAGDLSVILLLLLFALVIVSVLTGSLTMSIAAIAEWSILGIVAYSTDIIELRFYLCIQAVIVGVYWFLRFEPQFKYTFYEAVKELRKRVKSLILGEYETIENK